MKAAGRTTVNARRVRGPMHGGCRCMLPGVAGHTCNGMHHACFHTRAAVKLLVANQRKRGQGLGTGGMDGCHASRSAVVTFTALTKCRYALVHVLRHALRKLTRVSPDVVRYFSAGGTLGHWCQWWATVGW